MFLKDFGSCVENRLKSLREGEKVVKKILQAMTDDGSLVGVVEVER